MTVQPKKFKVLLIGDTCHDVYIFVESFRKNPESEAPLLTEINRLVTGGMARNVYRGLTNLELEVVPLFSQALSEKVRVIDAITGCNYFRLDTENKSEALDLNKIPYKDKFDAVVISDYNKGFVEPFTIEFIQDKFTCPVFLDTKKPDLYTFNKCIIKINSEEARVAINIPRNAIITEGISGAYTEDFKLPAMRVDCLDVCGAGDAFLAGLVQGYLQNRDVNTAMIHGIVNSGLSVTRYGTYSPTLKELKDGMKEYVKYCGEN
jgi:D-beta-D-heptose 7-phosphate kinase/D-beta-D-heptose 1-phosphate adenosyltransferase